jgi:uncharacterized membrane protein
MSLLSSIIRLAIVAAMFACAIGTAEACPTCKEAIHQNGSGTAYATSILFMMSMPFAIMAFWAILILNLRAKARRLAPKPEGLQEI